MKAKDRRQKAPAALKFNFDKWYKERLQIWVDGWEKQGYGVFVFFDKESGEFVGRAGLHHYLIDGIELLYALMPKYWNRGLATEMGTEILKLAFKNPRITSLVCFTLPENQGSLRVMEKLGFAFEKEITHVDLPHLLYRLYSS